MFYPCVVEDRNVPRLEDLRKSLLDKTPDELRERIRQIRAERRIYKEPRRVKKARATTTANNQSKMAKLLEAMSPEEREKFLQSLESET